MAERDRAPVDVELLLWDVELAPYALDAADGLVDLEESDVRESPTGSLEAALDRALALRAERLLVRPEREAVLILARQAALLCHELAAKAHVPVAICVHEPIGEIRVLHRVLAEDQTGAHAAHEVGCVRHRLHV